jgi:leucyl-tRNA synthetase
LINNHLTFFIYNHVAIFNKDKWPKAIRPNGHLLLNNEKMSKSTGNFLTLRECMDRYGADATRFALADAGDGLEDANFLEKTADDAILKLFTEREFIEETLNDPKIRSGEWTWNDKVFDAEINRVIIECQKAYDKMWFREAIKIGFYDLQHARNEYRKATTGNGMTLVSQDEVFENMHIDLLKRFAQIQALLLSPITPHWSESIWIDLLKNVIRN